MNAQPIVETPSVAEVLNALPHRAWADQPQWTAETCYPAYATMGARFLPERILEVGAFEGYGLISFWIGAGPTVKRLDWIDAETYAPFSNSRCAENLAAAGALLRRRQGGKWQPASRWARCWADLGGRARYDLIHVDAGHTFVEALADIACAWGRGPRVLLVDDFDYLPDVARAVRAFSEQMGAPFSYAPSFRGWAVFGGA